ncbi:hypothetical protein [Vibrio parahaemolyticus]|uniref:hypothetical protein n=1 Tax=Vibrio parahaemolyticus TaxID=670 RepID=UPI001EEC5560|nr:hypothetical protein [Vibrio parahaemolyticus]MCG6481009.1 hypothetical protein [Vibrio parahaemolyticus]HCG6765468.1 hypothetical protein [Vibrio parahaemolyticus]
MEKTILLLEKIVENTSNSFSSLWASVITGGTAVLVALVASFFTYRSAKETIELEKQKFFYSQKSDFVDRLRKSVGDFYTEVDVYYAHLKSEVKGSLDEYQKIADIHQQKIISLGNDIQISLDLNDKHQENLFNAIGATQSFLVNCALESKPERQNFNDTQYLMIKKSMFILLNEVCTKFTTN